MLLYCWLYCSIVGIYYTQKNIKKSYKNNNFKISAPTWNEEFDIPDYSEYISKNIGKILIPLQ